MKNLITALVVYAGATGCYAEFDLGVRTPRRDPCTGEVSRAAVHVSPPCRRIVPPDPRAPQLLR